MNKCVLIQQVALTHTSLSTVISAMYIPMGLFAYVFFLVILCRWIGYFEAAELEANCLDSSVDFFVAGPTYCTLGDFGHGYSYFYTAVVWETDHWQYGYYNCEESTCQTCEWYPEDIYIYNSEINEFGCYSDSSTDYKWFKESLNYLLTYHYYDSGILSICKIIL